MMFARTYTGHPVFAYSKDGCETWSRGFIKRTIQMPYAGLPTVKRIPSTGDLLFIWISERTPIPNTEKLARRSALTAAVSKNEGKTFIQQRNIARDPEDDFGYQCVEFLDKDTVLVGYHARNGIHVGRFGVQWFYGG